MESVRYLVRDDLQQAEASRTLPESLTSERPRYVCREVTVELVWALERADGFHRDRIATILEELVATEGLVIGEGDDVARAAFRYRAAGGGFSDLMVLAAADRSGAHPGYTLRSLSGVDRAQREIRWGAHIRYRIGRLKPHVGPTARLSLLSSVANGMSSASASATYQAS